MGEVNVIDDEEAELVEELFYNKLKWLTKIFNQRRPKRVQNGEWEQATDIAERMRANHEMSLRWQRPNTCRGLVSEQRCGLSAH